MNAVPASIKAPHEPQVNLLPPEVVARRARGRQKGFIAFAFIAFLAVLGFAVFWVSGQEAAAKQELQDAIDAGALLQAEIDTYQYVLDIEAELQTAWAARTYVGSTEVDFARLIIDIDNALPSGVRVENVTWSTTSVANIIPPILDPLAIPDIGSVQFRGRMTKYVSGADLEEALNGVTGLARVRIVSEQVQDDQGGGQYYAFEGTARVTALAFSGRFGATWLVADEISRAAEAMDERLTQATAVLEAAETDGTAEELAEAQAAYDTALADQKQMLAITQSVSDIEEEIASLQEAVDYGVEGAEAELALAIADLELVQPVQYALARAANAWDEEATNLATVEARIAAAEEYVALVEERVADAEAAVAAGDEGAEEALKEAQSLLMKAQYGLTLEQSFLAAAEEAEGAARVAFDATLAAAALVAPVDESTGGEES